MADRAIACTIEVVRTLLGHDPLPDERAVVPAAVVRQFGITRDEQRRAQRCARRHNVRLSFSNNKE